MKILLIVAYQNSQNGKRKNIHIFYFPEILQKIIADIKPPIFNIGHFVGMSGF